MAICSLIPIRPRQPSRANKHLVGVTYDLREDYLAAGYSELQTAEFDRSETIDAIVRELTALGHQVDRIGNSVELTRRLLAGDRWDLVFNICEGLFGFGREALVPRSWTATGFPIRFPTRWRVD